MRTPTVTCQRRGFLASTDFPESVRSAQGLIESSKFESGDLEVDEIQKRIGDAQLVFVLLLSLARQSRDITRVPNAVRTAAVDLDSVIATALGGISNALQLVTRNQRFQKLDDALNAFERSSDRYGCASITRPPLTLPGDWPSIAHSSPPSSGFLRNPCIQRKTEMKLRFSPPKRR